MKRYLAAALAAVVALGASCAWAQSTSYLETVNGKAVNRPVDDAHGLPMRCMSGCGGGTGGDASAAKQDAQTALLTTMDGRLVNLEGYVDGLETLVGTTNSNLASIIGDVDGIETLIGTTNTNLGTINTSIGSTNTLLTTQAGYLDGLEGALGATNESAAASDTATSGLNGLVKRLLQSQTTQNGYVDGLEGLLGTTNTNLGAPGATVCGSDTGSCSLNAQMQRLLQGITSANSKLTDIQTAANDTTSAKVQGGVASGSAASESPLPDGCRASSSAPTAVDDGDIVNVRCTLYGGVIAWPYTSPENYLTGLITSAMTGTTSTAVSGMGAPGAGLRNYVTEVSCANTHASVDTLVNIQDGSGGTVIAQLNCPHGFGGHQKIFPAPLRQPTTNTALYAVDVTTGASVTLSASGFKAP